MSDATRIPEESNRSVIRRISVPVTRVRIFTLAKSGRMTGVVMKMPHSSTAAVSFTIRLTFRKSPAPGYQREDSPAFFSFTASISVPSCLRKSVMSM